MVLSQKEEAQEMNYKYSDIIKNPECFELELIFCGPDKKPTDIRLVIPGEHWRDFILIARANNFSVDEFIKRFVETAFWGYWIDECYERTRKLKPKVLAEFGVKTKKGVKKINGKKEKETK